MLRSLSGRKFPPINPAAALPSAAFCREFCQIFICKSKPGDGKKRVERGVERKNMRVGEVDGFVEEDPGDGFRSSRDK